MSLNFKPVSCPSRSVALLPFCSTAFGAERDTTTGAIACFSARCIFWRTSNLNFPGVDVHEVAKAGFG